MTTSTITRPMLAATYTNCLPDFPLLATLKVDGMRALVVNGVLIIMPTCVDDKHIYGSNVGAFSEDYVYMFLALPPGDNVYADKSVYFKMQQGSTMLLQDFKNKFANYMRFRHQGIKYKWSSDYSPFHKLGYDVTYRHVCKACGFLASSECCDEYHPANRSKRYIIENIACVEKYVGE